MKQIKTKILYYLHTHHKPLMQRFYMMIYRKDLVKFLRLYDGDEILSRDYLISSARNQYGWGIRKATFMWGYCVYCELIENTA